MKTYIVNSKIKLILLIILVFISGCNDKNYTISTIVYPDGTCQRSLKVRYSKKPNFKDYPITIDSTWNVVIETDSVKEKVDSFFLYSKVFESVEAMNRQYQDTGNRYQAMDRNIKLKKRFKWFYTEYDYQETYEKLFSGKPLSDCLNDEGLSVVRDEDNDSLPVFNGMDSTEIEKYKDSIDIEYGVWISKTLSENFFTALYEDIEQNDSLQKYYDLIKKYETTMFNDSLFLDKGDLMLEEMDSFCMAEGRIKDYIEDDSTLVEFSKKNDFWGDIFLWVHLYQDLKLPGFVIETNADSVSKNTLYFSVYWDRFFTEDYIMKGVSRVKNIWTYYVSGGILLLALIALISGFIRKSIRKRSLK